MAEHNSKARPQPAFLFDLDGTLIDSVYQHVLAWREALEAEDIHLPNWYIHRRIGMSGGMYQFKMNIDRKSTRLNSSHRTTSYAVFCLKKKKCRSPDAVAGSCYH